MKTTRGELIGVVFLRYYTTWKVTILPCTNAPFKQCVCTLKTEYWMKNVKRDSNVAETVSHSAAVWQCGLAAYNPTPCLMCLQTANGRECTAGTCLETVYDFFFPEIRFIIFFLIYCSERPDSEMWHSLYSRSAVLVDDGDSGTLNLPYRSRLRA